MPFCLGPLYGLRARPREIPPGSGMRLVGPNQETGGAKEGITIEQTVGAPKLNQVVPSRELHPSHR